MTILTRTILRSYRRGHLEKLGLMHAYTKTSTTAGRRATSASAALHANAYKLLPQSAKMRVTI